MGETLSCSSCSGEIAARCEANLTGIQECLDLNVESALRGDWSEITEVDGEVKVIPLNPFSEKAIEGTTLMRNILTLTFFEAQRQLGCDLDERELKQKIMMIQGQ